MVNIQTDQEIVRVTDNKFEQHPEAYSPRVFVYAADQEIYFELLRTGEAIPWMASPKDRGFDFWIADVAKIADLGINRA